MAVLKVTGITYIKSGESLSCPRCNSRQSKSFKMMPKKFPKPEQTISELFDSDKFNKRVFRWENSYQCQKCGNEYVALFEDDHQNILQGRSPEEAKKALKKKSFLGKVLSFIFSIIKWLVLAFIILCIIVAIYD